ncbi:MAG: ATPase AAA [Leptospiraceae bacterium]|nr:MAG: ATPase AAA [Leptospiraceae bacterium]
MLELDFQTSKNQIESEIEKFISNSSIELPVISFEKGEFKTYFYPESLTKEQILDALGIIKQYIENVRIHTFDPNYIVFQSMGSNIYETKNFLQGIKYKFISIGVNRVEITKSGNLLQEEVQSIIEIIKYFYGKKQKFNFCERLVQLGTKLFCHPSYIKNKEDEKYFNLIEEDWNSLGGYDDIKTEIQETVILPLLHPEVFEKVSELARGKKIPNYPSAILFEGPPGVGKTSMARIIASESKIPMVYIPIENILSKYYGESAKNLSEIFDCAEKFERVILFLDEIDSLAVSREQGIIEATRRVLSVLLRKIDGFENKFNVLTIGATNRAKDLDHALLSRFDVIIRFPLPDIKERYKIFKKYIKHLSKEELVELAKISSGFSGRNIKDICEMAERKWSRVIIMENKEVMPPPKNIYEEIIHKKKLEMELWNQSG